MEFTDSISGFISYTFKPQLKTVGPKYGKLVGAIRSALAGVDGNAAMQELRAEGRLQLDISGEKIVLSEEDLLIESARKEGFVSESDQNVTVVLDTNLTPELVEEGFVREIISKIQTMRKEAGFEVMDRIVVYAKDNPVIARILTDHGDEIRSEVLADRIVLDEIKGYEKEWNINSEKVVMGVEKL